MNKSILHRAIRDLYLAVFVSAAIGLAISLITDFRNPVGTSILYSVCVGVVALAVLRAGQYLMWRDQMRPPWPGILLLAIVAAVFGQAIGGQLAILLLGIDERQSALARMFSHAGMNSVLFTLLVLGGAIAYMAVRDGMLRAQAAAAAEKARAEAVARQAVQAQLQALQAQIEPHMLFNTLANVQGLIAIDPARAQRMLDQLIQFLRATLSAARAEQSTLAREFAQMDAYLGLMAIRMGPRLSFELQLPDALRDLPLPPMLLQPLVENAIAHGLEPKVDGGHLAIRARKEDDMLVLDVQDNGRGPHAPPGKASTRVGLSNIRERLQALYGERASFSLEPALPSGALAQIRIPL